MKTELESGKIEGLIEELLSENKTAKTVIIILIALAVLFAIGKAMKVVSMTVSEYKQLIRIIES